MKKSVEHIFIQKTVVNKLGGVFNLFSKAVICLDKVQYNKEQLSTICR